MNFFLEKVYDEKIVRVSKLKKDLIYFKESKSKIERELTDKLEEIDKSILMIKEKSQNRFNDEIWDLQKEKRKIESQLSSVNHREFTINHQINKSEIIPYDSLKEFELSNVIRLGIAGLSYKDWARRS